MINIGNKVKKLRELCNYTQEYMANCLNLSVNSYGRLERNEVDITLRRVHEIAKILGIDYQTVLNFNEDSIFNFSTDKLQPDSLPDGGYKELIGVLKEELLY